MAFNRISLIKLLELVLAVSCLVLHYHSLGETDTITIILTSGTFLGFSIILIGLFVCYLINSPIHKRHDIFYSLVGCVLFIAAGALIIQEWENAFKTDRRKIALSKGSLSIINGAIFLFDIFFVFRS
ncbi:protein snakeskin-like [Lutzomyia longipalpis]|uniref:Putative conserved plasma membrane protein n=1 Tax=Lutzomyia longipalpis TaxID=7200 RepID=A0A1B0CF78_LUTLO|nr:protein snakeskin-like [Lutzomyia longipalpis]